MTAESAGGFEYLHYSAVSQEATQKEPSVWAHNYATLFLGDINARTQPSSLRESWIWDSNILWRVRPKAVVTMQHSCRHYVTVVE
jgi:hypothetical protein